MEIETGGDDGPIREVVGPSKVFSASLNLPQPSSTEPPFLPSVSSNESVTLRADALRAPDAEESSSIFHRITAPFRSIASTLGGRGFSAPSTPAPRPVLETVYVRESTDDSPKRRLSDPNAETKSLLTVEDNEEGEEKGKVPEVPAVRTREEEHQILLEAIQKRFVCPNFAADYRAGSAVPKKSSQDLKTTPKSRTGCLTGHMRVLPLDKSAEMDQIISKLEEAMYERRPPFDTWDNLLEKLSDVQRKQLVLNCANLEMGWSKTLGPGEDESGTRFRDTLATFHEMMDEISRDVLIIQNIDPKDASDTLPRRKSSDQPDLQGLHAKLFRSQETLEPTKDMRPFLITQMSSPVMGSNASSLNQPPRTFTAPNLLPLVRPTTDLVFSDQAEFSDSSRILSEPPRYPPPPVPLIDAHSI